MIPIDMRELTVAVDALRPMVRGDGGDLELLGVDGGVVELRLRLESAACADCVLPGELLEDVVFDSLRRSIAGVTAVRVEDPRRVLV